MKWAVKKFISDNTDLLKFQNGEIYDWFVLNVEDALNNNNNFYFFRRLLMVFLNRDERKLYSFNWKKIAKLYGEDKPGYEKILKKAGAKK